jgi:hypothetical protein
MPTDFAIKLDVDVKAEKEEKNNLILVGGPGTNLLTQEINEYFANQVQHAIQRSRVLAWRFIIEKDFTCLHR